MIPPSSESPGWDEVPGADAVPLLRVALAVGDAGRERQLLAILADLGVSVVARCLSADEVRRVAESARADVILLASDLHRLARSTLVDLATLPTPLVLLVEGSGGSFGDLGIPTVSRDADGPALGAALRGAGRGQHRPASARPRPSSEPATSHPPGDVGRHWVIALASGHGGPGRTTVALNLAAALGMTADTALVDLDLDGPSLVACLDADPTCNLAILAHQVGQDGSWATSLTQEVQPLGPRSPYGLFLGGVPKPRLRSLISVAFVERLIAELRQRYRYVVLDVGVTLWGMDAAVHRRALALADRVLLVTAGDVVGLAQCRAALTLLDDEVAVARPRLALVINQHDSRYHHQRDEIAYALGIPVAAVIPHDDGGVQRARARHGLLVDDRRSAAGGAILDLAKRIHGGKITLPLEPALPKRKKFLSPFRGPRNARGEVVPAGRSPHGIDPVRLA